MDEQKITESDLGNDTLALSEIVEAERRRLGIDKLKPPTQITAAIPDRELSPDEVEARRRAKERLALAQQKADREHRWNQLAAIVGERYADCSFDSFQANEKQRKAVAAIREYADTLHERLADSESLVLYGPVGTGKDHLALAVCRVAIIEHGRSVLWMNGQEWFGTIRDGMDASVSEQSIVGRLVGPSILVLSDPLPPFGALTQHQATMMYRLVERRYARGKVTICTVNVASDEEADQRLGVATWDRLCDRAWKVHCNWPSYRKPAREVK
jgi:DNA replication protein DnaC